MRETARTTGSGASSSPPPQAQQRSAAVKSSSSCSPQSYPNNEYQEYVSQPFQKESTGVMYVYEYDSALTTSSIIR